MAKAVKLSELIERVRVLADCEGEDPDDGFITDAAIKFWLNAAIGEFDDLLLLADSATRRKPTDPIAVVSGTDTYALPDDFLDLKRVEWQLDATHWEPVREIPFDQKHRWEMVAPRVIPGCAPFRYCLNNDGSGWGLILVPAPSSGAVVRAWYTPAFTTLVNPDDELDGVNGLEEFVVVSAAIKCAQKEESDVSVLLAQKAALVARIEDTAKARDQAAPATIGDAGEISGWDGWDC